MGTDYKPGTLLNLCVDGFISSSQLYKADLKEGGIKTETEKEKSVNLSRVTQPVKTEVGFETGQ